jgi:hypothetical protein
MYRRKDGKHFVYFPQAVVGDSAFPFNRDSSVPVSVVIDPKGERILILPLDKAKGQRRRRD